MDEPKYLIVRKRDDSPVEVLPFNERTDAEQIFDAMSEQWTECYLCAIIKPKREIAAEEEQIKYTNEALLDADPNCEHVVVDAPGGGVRCTKCPGWMCL